MGRLYAKVGEVEWAVARMALWAMVVLIFAAALARLLGSPMNWAIDISTFLFAWSCFLSADVTWRQGKLMNVDVLVRVLPARVQRVLRLVNYVIISAFLLYLIGFGVWLSYSTRARAFQGIPGFSYTWVTLAVPVGGLFLLVTTILKIREELRPQ
jgi:TRAP-type C4-dicarboxylate transport system permease small subunit